MRYRPSFNYRHFIIFFRFDDAVEIIYKIVAEPDRISPRVEFKQGNGSGSVVENKFSLLPQKLTGLSTDTGIPKFSCVTQIAYLKVSQNICR